LNEQGEPPSDTRNTEDVDASSTMNSDKNVEKLSVDQEQKCSDEEEVSTAADDVDQAKPAVTVTEPDGTVSTIGEKSDQTADVKDATESSLKQTDTIVTDGGIQSEQQENEQHAIKEMTETDGNDDVVVDDEITFMKHKRPRMEPNWFILHLRTMNTKQHVRP